VTIAFQQFLYDHPNQQWIVKKRLSLRWSKKPIRQGSIDPQAQPPSEESFISRSEYGTGEKIVADDGLSVLPGCPIALYRFETIALSENVGLVYCSAD